MGQYNYRASPVNSIMSNNWGQPTDLLGSGGYGVAALNLGSEMFSQPIATQQWGEQYMGPPSSAMGDLAIPSIGATIPGQGGNWWDGATGPNGWGGMALGAASGLMQGFLGMKQYGLAKKTLEENKRQFQMNYDAQKQSTNTRLEDRQRARVASNSGAYQSVGDYMGANKIA